MEKKRINSKEILLWILRAGGIIILSMANPKLPHYLLKSYLKNRYRLRERLKMLEERGWIKITEVDDQFKLELVENGREVALYYKIEEMHIKKPKKWDGLWRVVVFDIPEDKKIARDVLRRRLKELGFIQLQKSVFILPYDCKKEIEVIQHAYEIWPYMSFMIVKEIDNEDKLIKRFNLKNE